VFTAAEQKLELKRKDGDDAKKDKERSAKDDKAVLDKYMRAKEKERKREKEKARTMDKERGKEKKESKEHARDKDRDKDRRAAAKAAKAARPAPPASAAPKSDYSVAIHDYEAQNPGELSLRRHDVVIVREERGEWWRGVNARGEKGDALVLRVCVYVAI
jgi:hypothetical protein